MEPSHKKKTSSKRTEATPTTPPTKRKLSKKHNVGKESVQVGQEPTNEHVPLAKRKSKKKQASAVNVTEDLQSARKAWRDKEAKSAKPVPEALRGNDGVREEPPKGAPMPFAVRLWEDPAQRDTQRMVASARDLMDVKALQELRPDVYGKLTVNQVWVLVAAERKGELQHELDMRKSTDRLKELNETYGTTYTDEDLHTILKSLRERRVASNFYLTLPPGGNREENVGGDSLLDVLIADDEGRFRNVWETGVSQASNDLGRRGGAEERFGYAFALKRTKGTPLALDGNEFATQQPTGRPVDEDDMSPTAVELRRLQAQFPTYVQPRELPKYGAAVGPSQAFGVSARYGSSVVYWKTDIDWRTTRSPGDSWSGEATQSGLAFVSANYPESVFAYTQPDIARLAAAEATGFKHDKPLRDKVREDGANLWAYIEAQIHGDLSWHDVDEIVLNYGTFGKKDGDVVVTREMAVADSEKLTKFAKEKSYGFTVRVGRQHSVPTGGHKA
jgi:hypothetical protein